MALHINPFLKSNNDTGFGNYDSGIGGRFVNRDGTFNVRRKGQRFFDTFSIYNSLLTMPALNLMVSVFSAFFLINIFFTSLYVMAGPDALGGYDPTTFGGFVLQAFYFSCQTFTTVGYGHTFPVNNVANFISLIEAFCGFFSFAFFTGIVYGRFTKPKANLVFSDNALIAPYRNMSGLMFRFASKKDSHTLTSVQVVVSVGMQVLEDGKPSYKFYNLDLERSHVDSLPMNLTVVHPISESSPLFGYNSEELIKADVEVYVLVKAFDDVYSTTVQQRTSYVAEEIVYGAKFLPMYYESKDGRTTWIEMHKLNEYREAELPVTPGEKTLLEILQETENSGQQR